MTFPGLFILITSLLSAFLARYISQKKLAVTGLILNTATAVGGFLFHGNIVVLFCWAAALGLGIGMWMPLVNAIASAHFEGNERASLLGRISSAQNIGAVFMTVVGGALAVIAWHFVYLVYFIAVPGLICAVIYLPDEKAHRESRRGGGLGIDGTVILFGMIQLFSACLIMLRRRIFHSCLRKIGSAARRRRASCLDYSSLAGSSAAGFSAPWINGSASLRYRWASFFWP